MSIVAIYRTPELIAAEINFIKSQTKRMMLNNSIEIGRRLVEAKELLEHGEWGKWLEASVDYSQSTANNLMRIFDEYGSKQITLLDDNAVSEALGKLSYTQAVALFGLPAEEREQFIAENVVESMSTRELQDAIKAKKDAEERAKGIEAELQQAQKRIDSAMKSLEEKTKEIETLGQKVNTSTKSLQNEMDHNKELQQAVVDKDKQIHELKAKEKEIADLKKQLKDRPIEATAATVIEKIPEDVEKELTELRAKANQNKGELEKLNARIKELVDQPIEVIQSGLGEEDIEKIKADAVEQVQKDLKAVEEEKARIEKQLRDLEAKASQPNKDAIVKFSVYFKELVEGFKKLLETLPEIKEVDAAAYEKYRDAVSALIGKMSERL